MLYKHKYDINDYIAGRVRQKRAESNVSQQQLADILGISQAKLSCIESGKVIISAADIYAISLALRCDATCFFTRENNDDARLLNGLMFDGDNVLI